MFGKLNYRISADHAKGKKPQWALAPHLRLLPSLLSSKGVYILGKFCEPNAQIQLQIQIVLVKYLCGLGNILNDWHALPHGNWPQRCPSYLDVRMESTFALSVSWKRLNLSVFVISSKDGIQSLAIKSIIQRLIWLLMNLW